MMSDYIVRATAADSQIRALPSHQRKWLRGKKSPRHKTWSSRALLGRL